VYLSFIRSKQNKVQKEEEAENICHKEGHSPGPFPEDKDRCLVCGLRVDNEAAIWERIALRYETKSRKMAYIEKQGKRTRKLLFGRPLTDY